MKRAAAWAAGLGLLIASVPVTAAEYDIGDLHLETSGSVRGLYRFTRDLASDRDETLVVPGTRDDVWSLLTRVRNGVEGSYRDRWFFDVVYDVELRTGTSLDTANFRLADAIGTGTWLDADRRFSHHRDLDARHVLYRAWVRYQDDDLEITLGRQRIPLGRARLWNPIDLFNPILPLAIEGQQRIGQDAALIRYRLREDVHAVGIWAPMDEPDEHRAAFRLELSRPELDASLMAGYFVRDTVIGADFATNVYDAAVRGEMSYSFVDDGQNVWQIVLSADYEFAWGTGLYALIEHFYNENRVKLDRITQPVPITALTALQSAFLDRIATRDLHQTGMSFDYDLTPLVNANVLTLYDWHGRSTAIFPAVSWSAREDLDVRVGAQLFWGKRHQSQYGDQANLIFMQLDWYF